MKCTLLLLVFSTIVLNHCNSQSPAFTAVKEPEVITIPFSDDISLQWDVASQQLLQNTNYQRYQEDSKAITLLLNSITDTTNLKVMVCSKEKPLRKGDVAFLYLQKTLNIPLFQCFYIQFDVFEKKCTYPSDLLNYVEEYRTEVQQKLRTYLGKSLSNPKIGVQATLNYTDANREYAEAVIVNYSGKPIEINTYYVFHFGLQYEDENGEVKDIQGCLPPSIPPANLDDCKKTLQKGEKYNLVYYIIHKMINCQDIIEFDKPVLKIRASIRYKYPNDKKYNVAYTNWITYEKHS